jgi:hypothetical protein
MRVLMTALAAAASIAIATPALAAPTVTDTNGTPLSQQIFGIAGTGTTVFGSSPDNNGTPNVRFTGDTQIQIGSGFAQINDPTPDTADWFSLIIDPDVDFTDFKFSVMLTDQDGTVSVFALLTGESDFVLVDMFDAGRNNLNQLLSGGTFDAFKIVSSAPIAFFEVKQLSFNAAPGAVPEPGSWAMMLLGFAGIGASVRRARKSGRLLQIA